MSESAPTGPLIGQHGFARGLAAQTEELRRENERLTERFNDVRDELRRHVDAQEKRAKRAEQARDDYRAAVRRAQLLRVWTNEDGKRFVFADELFEALEVPHV